MVTAFDGCKGKKYTIGFFYTTKQQKSNYDKISKKKSISK